MSGESVPRSVFDDMFKKFSDMFDKYAEEHAEAVRLRQVLDDVTKYAKRLACPTRLRYSMELFPVRYLYSADQAAADQNIIHQKLLDVLQSTSRVQLLTNCIMQMASVHLKGGSEKFAAFKEAFDRLKRIKFELHPCTEEFGMVVYEIYQLRDVHAAFSIWKGANLFWKNRTSLKTLLPTDEDIVKKLTFIPVDELLRKIKVGEYDLLKENICKDYQLEYTMACLATKNILHPDASKQYKSTMWTLYMSPNPEITELWKELAEEWPEAEKHVRADWFCSEFVELYNLVSVVDKHGPGLQPPSNCEPSSEDFTNYIRHLASTRTPRFCFVAKTLCVP